MRGGESPGNLGGIADGIRQREARGGDKSVERFAFDILHNQVIHPAVIRDVIERHDVRMIQRGGRARFLKKTPFAFRVGYFVAA